jgi:hypothetical protein
MYECDKCGYISNKKCNLEKHKKRKNPCGRAYIGNDKVCEENDGGEHNVTQKKQNVTQNIQNVTIEEQNVTPIDSKIKCNYCKNSFFNHQSLKRHALICKGVDNLTCFKCKCTFKTRNAKYYHLKNVKCDNKQIIIPNETVYNVNGDMNTTTNNTIHNNNTILNNTQNNHIHINCFGKEDLSYLLKDNNLIHRINNYSKDGVYGLVKMIDDIYLNQEKPENNTIIKPNERGDGLYIRSNDDWEYREFEDIKDDLIKSLDKYIDIYKQVKQGNNIQLTEPKERRRIKRFVTILLTVGGMLNEDLCNELQIDEDDIDEEEEDKMNKKFGNATMDKLHKKTHVMFKRINGKMTKVLV